MTPKGPERSCFEAVVVSISPTAVGYGGPGIVRCGELENWGLWGLQTIYLNQSERQWHATGREGAREERYSTAGAPLRRSICASINGS
jgi:hypothetical protein